MYMPPSMEMVDSDSDSNSPIASPTTSEPISILPSSSFRDAYQPSSRHTLPFELQRSLQLDPRPGFAQIPVDQPHPSLAESRVVPDFDSNEVRLDTLGSRLPSNAVYPPFARRVVSAPVHAYSTSPRSPLSYGSPKSGLLNNTGYATSSSPPRPPVSPGSPPLSPFSNNINTFHMPASSQFPHHRRRSSASATPFGSLVGSYENSLLSGRMSATPSREIQFHSSIGVLGTEETPAKLRCPPHLGLPFGAFYYEGVEGNKGGCPYVGTIDLQAHYTSLLETSTPSLLSTSSPLPLPPMPRFPGYRIPVKGQIQLVIKNGNSAALKLFLIPYDLNGLNRGGEGGRTFLRQKSYSVVVDETTGGYETVSKPSTSLLSGGGDATKGRLRYAVHLQFCSPPLSTSSSLSGRHEPRYYLHNTIRVVFASRALDSSEKLVVVSEGLEGMTGERGTTSFADGDEQGRFAPYKGPGIDWEMARKKRKVKEKMWSELAGKEGSKDNNSLAEQKSEEREDDANDEDEDNSGGVHDPDVVSESYEASPQLEGPLLNTPPSPSSLDSSMSLSTLSNHLPSSLSFERTPPSSTPGATFARKDSGEVGQKAGKKSGLSSSRPGSSLGREF